MVLKKMIKGTLLSILIFFSISFLTVLLQINSPINQDRNRYELNIGYPLTYYYEFIVDCPFPNSGWIGKNLLIDVVCTWGITILVFLMIDRSYSEGLNE